MGSVLTTTLTIAFIQHSCNNTLMPYLSTYASRLFSATSSHCWYCGKVTAESDQTVDHIIPSVRNGSNLLFNIVPACRRCNSQKGSMPINEFRIRLAFWRAGFKVNWLRTGPEITEFDFLFWGERNNLFPPLVAPLPDPPPKQFPPSPEDIEFDKILDEFNRAWMEYPS